jgi:hypothetical protein
MKRATDPATAEEALTRKWVEAWAIAGPELDRQRRQEIRAADTASAIPAFDDLFEQAVQQFPPPDTSGLVEQQRWLRLTRK